MWLPFLYLLYHWYPFNSRFVWGMREREKKSAAAAHTHTSDLTLYNFELFILHIFSYDHFSNVTRFRETSISYFIHITHYAQCWGTYCAPLCVSVCDLYEFSAYTLFYAHFRESNEKKRTATEVKKRKWPYTHFGSVSQHCQVVSSLTAEETRTKEERYAGIKQQTLYMLLVLL